MLPIHRWLSHEQMHVHRFRERTHHGNEREKKRNMEHETHKTNKNMKNHWITIDKPALSHVGPQRDQ